MPNLLKPGGSDGKESVSNVGDMGLIPGSGRSSEEGNDYHSRITWKIPWTEDPGGQATVHGVTNSWT